MTAWRFLYCPFLLEGDTSEVKVTFCVLPGCTLVLEKLPGQQVDPRRVFVGCSPVVVLLLLSHSLRKSAAETRRKKRKK